MLHFPKDQLRDPFKSKIFISRMAKQIISVFSINGKEDLCITMPMDLISLPEQTSLFDVECFISSFMTFSSL